MSYSALGFTYENQLVFLAPIAVETPCFYSLKR